MSTHAFNEHSHPRDGAGKFSEKPVDEATGGLTALTPDDGGDHPLSGHELLDEARSAVNRVRRGRNQSMHVRDLDDDMVSDVVEVCLRRQARGQKTHAGYVYVVARNLLSRDRNMHSSQARALRMLSGQVAEAEQAQGHEASRAQVVAFAEKILAEWPADQRKPSTDFYRIAKVVSLDAQVESGTAMVDMIEDRAGAYRPTHLDDGTGEEPTNDAGVYDLLDRHERAVGKAEHMAIKRDAWDAMADLTGAPKVTGSLTKHHVTAARTIIVRHPDGPDAGIKAAMSTWDSGEQDQYTDALFTPFGTKDIDERQAIVDQLRTAGPHAADLWSGALAAANARHQAVAA
ncbi:hypothetical protein [Oerskovia enterophila]|uniref:Uncharacterized protein n=1 Tax=Oerskovia enterophila TaxID=43678 RepID=A0ABX2Y9W2_9CELL|nr:hypothetical protein [Oerskovia enterophila]OCI32811.1 hypothetical protein OERS_04030 [Oerskovia enterophila]